MFLQFFWVFVPIIGLMIVVNRFFGLKAAAVIGIGVALSVYGFFAWAVCTFIGTVLGDKGGATFMAWFFAVPIVILYLPKIADNLPLPWNKPLKIEPSPYDCPEKGDPDFERKAKLFNEYCVRRDQERRVAAEIARLDSLALTATRDEEVRVAVQATLAARSDISQGPASSADDHVYNLME